MPRTNISRRRSTGRWTSSVTEKLNWLRDNVDKYPTRRHLVFAMKEAKLLSKLTYWKDCRVEVYLDILARERDARQKTGA